MLPEATQITKEESSNKQQKNSFLERLIVLPENLAKNVKKQQINNKQIIKDKKDGPSLNN